VLRQTLSAEYSRLLALQLIGFPAVPSYSVDAVRHVHILQAVSAPPPCCGNDRRLCYLPIRWLRTREAVRHACPCKALAGGRRDEVGAVAAAGAGSAVKALSLQGHAQSLSCEAADHVRLPEWGVQAKDVLVP